MTRSELKPKFSIFEFGEDDKRVEEEAGKLAGKYKMLRNSSRASALSCSSTLPHLPSKSTSDQYNIYSSKKRSRLREVFKSIGEAVDVDEYERCDSRILKNASDFTPIWISPDPLSPKSDSSLPFDVLDLSTSSRLENEASGIDPDCVELNALNTKSISERIDASEEVNLKIEEFQVGDTQTESGSESKKVVLYPDVILYRDTYMKESLSIAFCGSCVQVLGSAITKTMRTIDMELAVHDILLIECEWCASVDIVKIIIHFRPDKDNEDRIEFFIICPSWIKERESIQSLNIVYHKAWKDTPMSELYFDDVIYPTGDPDAVTITCNDAELLKPQRYLNDTIIDFYIKYLKNKIPSEQQKNFHFFNCFFFRKLAAFCKNLFESKTSLYNWTKHVNLFEKDYIFIPVNFSFHWSLIVICHPGKFVHPKDETGEFHLHQPCVLHMDSLRGSHYGLKSLIRRFLCEEWKERYIDANDYAKFLNFDFFSLEVPQQENSYDCGVFLVQYVELFLHEILSNFTSISSNFLKESWFDPNQVSSKRTEILRLIYRISNLHFPAELFGASFQSPPSSNDASPEQKNSEGFVGCQIYHIDEDMDE